MYSQQRYVLGCALVAGLGGLLFGFDTAVISGANADLQRVFDLSNAWLGFTVSSALIGTVIGALTAGEPADRYGRRPMLFVLALLFLVSAVGSALATNWWAFVLFRFVGGVGVGGASVVSPMYVSELSPAEYRGRMTATFQFNIVVGILVAQLSNYVIGAMALGASDWRWMFGVEAAPAVLFLGLLAFVPESPRWLVAAGRADAARGILGRTGTDSGDVRDDIDKIRRSLRQKRSGVREALFQAKYVVPISLAVAIAAFNQLSGINAILYYAPRIFRMAGVGEDAALLQTAMIGGVNLVATAAAMLVIDWFGRRRLMLIGSVGYITSLATVATAFFLYGEAFQQGQAAAVGAGSTVVLASIMVFIASHAVGQGAVIWVFISEIFPNEVRARGQSLGVFTHWAMNFVVSWLFPVLAGISVSLTFGIFCGFMVLQLLWVLILMPETKGVPLEEMRRKLDIERADVPAE
ncbi:MAG: MFS transporter [Bacteroidetes bacterium QS_8_68_28]|nr:MAG: MFS transporter [Bacteroidetes bacterium QS_8_68_28]